MKNYRFIYALLLAVGVLAAPLSAHSQAVSGLQDPGFSYVDVNNDGYFNAADGDIPVSAQVMDGYFDTSRSELGYNAPCYPVSLVVSRAQVITPGVPVCLRAGVNLIVFDNLNDPTRPTITLNACRNIYLAGTANDFQNCMTINAGVDVNIDGALFAGSDPASKLTVSAGRDISARPYVATSTASAPLPPPTATNIAVGSSVSLCSNGCTVVDGAGIALRAQGGTISLAATGDLEVIDHTNISTNAGCISAQSHCGLVRVQDDDVFGNTLNINAYDAAIVDGSLFDLSGSASIQANGPVSGLSSIVVASSFTVCSCDCVDLDSSLVDTSSGSINVTGQLDVTANSATWTSGVNIGVTSKCADIYVRTADMEANPAGRIQFYAGGGLIDVTGAFIFPFPSYRPNNVTVIGSLRAAR